MLTTIKRLLGFEKKESKEPVEGNEILYTPEELPSGITEVRRKDVGPYDVLPGDTFELTYTDSSGEEYLLLQEPINRKQTIDTVAVFEIDNALGFESGFFGVFGKRKEG